MPITTTDHDDEIFDAVYHWMDTGELGETEEEERRIWADAASDDNTDYHALARAEYDDERERELSARIERAST